MNGLVPSANIWDRIAAGEGAKLDLLQALAATVWPPDIKLTPSAASIVAGGSVKIVYSCVNSELVSITSKTADGVSVIDISAFNKDQDSLQISPDRNVAYSFTVNGPGGCLSVDVAIAVAAAPVPPPPPPPPPPPAVSAAKYFDFGTPTSPVAASYVGVSHLTKYDPAVGYGWVAGTIDSRDRGVKLDDKARDFCLTSDGTFQVDLPNGVYTLVLGIGDVSYSHDQQGIFIQGVQVDSVSTIAAPPVTKNYLATVSDGKLLIQFKDLGGTDKNVCITSLDVLPGDTNAMPQAG